MNRTTSRLRWQQARASGALRPVVATASLALGLWTWLLWLPQRLEAQQARQQAAQVQALAKATPARPPSREPAARLDAAQAQALVQAALEHALQSDLRPGRAELQWPNAGDEAPALLIQIPLEGSYPALASWLQAVQQNPGIQLAALLLTHRSPAAGEGGSEEHPRSNSSGTGIAARATLRVAIQTPAAAPRASGAQP